jgi:hypothetical protein
MQLPFSLGDFLNIFKEYNEAVFPLQIIFYFIAFFSIYLIFTKYKYSNKIVNSFLSFFWLWIGIVYHLIFFSTINNAAYFFGIMFIIQGVLFTIWGVFKNSLSFEYKNSTTNIVGIILLLYALIFYPVIGYQLGHVYPYSPTFGLPCPTTIFTFGILLFANKRVPVFLLIIPLLWSVIGFSAAINLTIYEDTGLIIAGVTAVTLLLINNRNYPKEVTVKL